MDATVVVGGLDQVVVVADLGVLAQPGVVVGGARRRHVAQRPGLHPLAEQLGPDQPVGVGGALAEHPLPDAAGEDVGHRLVERPRLAVVDQTGGVLGERVHELVGQHVDAAGEAQEELAVAVAEDQLGAVPEGVDVALAVVDGRADGAALAVVGVAAVDLGQQGERGGDAGGRLVDGLVAGRRLARGARTRSPGRSVVPAAVCTTQSASAATGATSPGAAPPVPAGGGAERGVEVEGARGGVVAALREAAQEVGRQDLAAGAGLARGGPRHVAQRTARHRQPQEPAARPGGPERAGALRG